MQTPNDWSDVLDGTMQPGRYAIEKLPEDLQTAIGKLMPFTDPAPDKSDRAISYESRGYLELMDWPGRAVVEGKRRYSRQSAADPETVKIDPASYVEFINPGEKSRFGNFIGPIEAMRNLAERFSKPFREGQTAAAQLFSPG
ncbi:MAG: hypothetical protein KGY53_13070 [Wenzhouxiangellaceae bacterium]|nr:hypothetical protein [Wenzhouxiangellaceae bacterium]MBS3824816.1 hypothetical protein [Wenzhouxiangellaceae bacterium]